MEKLKKIFKDKYNVVFIILFIIAVCVRLIYINKYDYMTNQHDVEPNGNGLSYIYDLYNYNILPTDNAGQHYHSPCHQIICAYALKIIDNFTTDEVEMNESLQYVTVIYSLFLWIAVYKITKEIKLDKRFAIFVMMSITLNPTLIILAGSINNDGLCLTFSIWTMYYLIKWFNNTKDSKNIIKLAILTGLTVMTKTSGGIIAIPIIYVFILRFYKDMKKAKDKNQTLYKYLWMFMFFGCISLPIGLWYNIRNYILFNQPIFYILDTNNKNLYRGDYTILQRFLSFDIASFKNMYCDPWTEYNIPEYLIKCSVFGEFHFNSDLIWLYKTVITSNIIMLILSINLFLVNLFTKCKRYIVLKISMIIMLIFNIFAYIKVNIDLPYGCTMDFRYLTFALIAAIILIGIDLNLGDRNNKNKTMSKLVYYAFMIISLIINVGANILMLV